MEYCLFHNIAVTKSTAKGPYIVNVVFRIVQNLVE